MIPAEFIKSLDLPPGKMAALQSALQKEEFYRTVLYKAGVMPRIIPSIMRTVDTSGIDTTKEEYYTEAAKVEYKDFIPQKGQ